MIMAGKFKNQRGKQPSRKEREQKKSAKVISIEPEPTTIPDIGTSDFDAGNFHADESLHNDQSITQDIIEKPQFEIPQQTYSPKTKVMSTIEDAKTWKIAKISFAAVSLIMISLIYLNFPHTYMHQYHVRAGGFFSALGLILLLGGGSLGFWANKLWSGQLIAGIYFGSLVLGILCGCGWNFDLHGIEPGA